MLDNTQAVVYGEWPDSTVVAGYYGEGYQYHAGNGAPPGGILVDNGSAGFATTGEWPTSTVVDGYYGESSQYHTPNGAPPGDRVLDNTDAGASASGAWGTSASTPGYVRTRHHYHAPGSGSEAFTWSVPVPTEGTYRVYARWTAHANRATNATYTIEHAAGTTPVVVNQQQSGGRLAGARQLRLPGRHGRRLLE